MGRGGAWARVALGASAYGVVCAAGAAPGSASHVAKGLGSACEGLRGEIDEIRAMVRRERAAAAGAEAQVEAAVAASSVAEIVRTCFVKFVGDDEIARRVASLPGVDYVEENGEAHVEQSGGNWNLDRIDQAKLPLDGVQFVPQNQANGVRIYVVDTGVLSTHTEFGNRAKNVVNVSPDDTPGDEHGHGTICASIAAGNELGIARKAIILGVKVFGKTGTGQGTSIIDGLEWIVKNAPGPSVISMSISSEAAAVRDAAIAASDAGHIVVVAAGNQDQDACIRAPGSAGGTGDQGGIITVASTGEGDKRSTFSSYGTCVDIFAPGEGIQAATVRGTSNSAVALNSGTSMACPHVAGVAAGLLGKHNLDKDAAIKELFDTVTTGVITDTLRSPNKLVYAEARRELPPTVQGAPAPTAGGEVANTIAAPKNVAKTVRNGALGLLSVLGLFALLGAFIEWRRSNSEHAKLMREHRKKVAAAHQRRLKRKREKELQRQQLATVQDPPSSWSPISSLQSAGARLSGARASFRRAESASPRTGTSVLSTAQANAGSEASANTEQPVSTRIINMLTSPRMSIRKPAQSNPTSESCVDLNTHTEVTASQASITTSSAEVGVSLSPQTSTQQLQDESITSKPSPSRSSTRAPRPPVNDSDMV